MAKQNLPESDHNKPTDNDAGDRLREYAKYSGMAFQMGLIILVGTLIGKRLDAHFQLQRPYLTIVMALLSISLALYVVLKDLIWSKKQ